MNQLSCRPAVLHDVPALLPMMAAFNAGEGIAFSAGAFQPPLETLIRNPELGAALVFEKPGVIGYGVVTWNFDLEYGGRDAFLTELWIEPAFRGNGMGRAALALLEGFARAQGAAALHLAVRGDNTAAVRLYETSGYEDLPRRFLSKKL